MPGCKTRRPSIENRASRIRIAPKQASIEKAIKEPDKNLEKLEQTVLSWPDVSVQPHRFGGREFRYGAAEIGHIHPGGILDIPFTRPLHDALLAAGLAQQHRWVPNSGWVTLRIRTPDDLQHGLWLMRLSYLRYSLKRASDPKAVLERETFELRLTAEFKSLLAQFLPPKSHLAEASAH